MPTSKKLLLIDGNNLFHRAYHALPPLTDKSGENANAVFGFSNMIIKAIGEVKPTYVAAAFDTKAPTFRHVEFEAYKAQRVAPPPDLYPQLPKAKSVLDAFGIRYFEKAGYEADDLLASIASKVKSQKSKVKIIILSGDRDLLQMVDGNIKVQMPGWNLQATTLFGSLEVKEKYGLEPHQMVDYKSLTGDPSDNVPGVAGIGPKTASQLLQKYHTLENLYDHLDEIPETTRAKLDKDKEVALAAKKLVELDTTIGLGIKIEDLRYQPDTDQVTREFEKLGFKSIVAKFSGKITEELSLTPKALEGRKEKKAEKNNSDQLELV